MMTNDRLLDDVATRLGITPTEANWSEWWYESEEFDLDVSHSVSGTYEARLVLDGSDYATISCRDHAMLAVMVRAALDHEHLGEAADAA